MTAPIDVLGDALVAAGVRAIFGIPGSGASLRLITRLESHGVPFHAACHEASAAVMSGAFGACSGTLGCSVSIRGPGLSNGLAGILCNRVEHRPTLSIAESLGVSPPAGMAHKRLDHVAITAPYVKAYGTLGEPASTLRALIAAARAEVPGPVHLDLAHDEPPVLRRPAPLSTRPAVPVADLMAGLDRARRPIVIAGSLAVRRGWGERVAALRVPVFTTLAAKGLIDERHPFAAGVFTGDGKALAPESRLLAEADLVVGLGVRASELLRPPKWPCSALLLDVVDGVADGLGATLTTSGATDSDIDSVLAALASRAWGADRVGDAVAAVRARLLEDPWLPGRVYETVRNALPEPACFVADTGWFCTAAEHVWPARTPQGFLASANGRSMGTGLPMAIGAALADRRRPTVCALGDGGVRMYIADLRLAVEERLPLLCLLLSDGRLGSVAGDGTLSRRATAVAGASWYRIAEAMDCAACQVKDIDGLTAALARWRMSDGPLFVEAVFDPDRYAAMTRDIR
jgi:acetolactate synthase-1/2/3 large subunit